MSLTLNASSSSGSSSLVYSDPHDDYDIDEEVAAVNSTTSTLSSDVNHTNSPFSDPKGFTKQRRGSREFIYPAPQSHQRQSTLHGAVFNLSATILGGGILTLPFCFQLCGIIFGSFFLVAIAAASNFSIYILVSCSRRIRHGASYEEVVSSTFGRMAGRMIVFTMFALVYLCIVAYTLLIRDLVTPLLELLFNTEYSSLGRFVIVSIVLLAVLPLCLQKNLSSISCISIVSIGSMLLLAYCVMYRGIESLLFPSHMEFTPTHHSSMSTDSVTTNSYQQHEEMMSLKLAPSRWSDVLYAAPIFTCAYICHFNVLPLHRELIHPTRPRIKRMIYYVVSFCTALYLAIGIFGYIYARGYTDGNILNNFRTKDILATIGRIALAFTCITGLPMIVLPARALLGKILAIIAPALLESSSNNQNETISTTSTAAAAAAAPPSSSKKQYIVYEGPYGPNTLSLYSSEAFDSHSDDTTAGTSSGFHAIYDSSRRVGSYDSFSSHIDRDPLQPQFSGEFSESEDEDDVAQEASFLADMIRRATAVAAAVGAGLTSSSSTTTIHTSSADYSDMNKSSESFASADVKSNVSQSSSQSKEIEEEYLSPLSINSASPSASSTQQQQQQQQQRFSNEITPLIQQHSSSNASLSSTPKKLNSHLGHPNEKASSSTTTTTAAAIDAWNGVSSSSSSNHPSSSSSSLPMETEPQFSAQSLRIQTICISFSALLCSLRVSSVATLWNLLGSSVCLILGFIVPSACYLKIRKDKPLGFRMLCAWLLLIGGIVMLIVCMMESVTALSAFNPSSDASSSSSSPSPIMNDNLPTIQSSDSTLISSNPTSPSTSSTTITDASVSQP